MWVVCFVVVMCSELCAESMSVDFSLRSSNVCCSDVGGRFFQIFNICRLFDEFSQIVVYVSSELYARSHTNNEAPI